MTLSADEVVDRCAEFSGLLAARASEAEQARRMPESTMDDLVRLDLLRMVVPTSLGGHGLGVKTLGHSTRLLAHGCMASAWTISFLVMHNWLLTRFPPAARQELFTTARPWTLTPAPLAPTGTLEVVDEGFSVSGRWEWATGIHHADWVMVHAVQTVPVFATHFVLVPIGEVQIDDVWHTSGMCATGSDTVCLERVFVPAHRTIPAATMMFGGEQLAGDGMGLLAVPPVLAMIAAAPALGAAETAVDLYRERVATRVLAYSLGDRAVEQPAAQIRLGTVISDLAAARTRWDAAIEEMDADAQDGCTPIEQRMAWRLTAAATVRAARSIVNTIAEGAGASVYFASSPFQRIQRDLEVLKGHVIFDWDRTTELAGKVALGLDLKPTDMV